MPYTMWIKYLLTLLIGFGLINSSYGKLSLSQYVASVQCEKKLFYIPLICCGDGDKGNYIFFYNRLDQWKAKKISRESIFPMKNRKFQRRWWKRMKSIASGEPEKMILVFLCVVFAIRIFLCIRIAVPLAIKGRSRPNTKSHSMQKNFFSRTFFIFHF